MTRTGANLCRWVFSEAVTAVANVAGLASDGGGEGIGWTLPAGAANAIDVQYADDPVVGGLWFATPGIVEITFASGRPLQYAAGTIEE